MPASKADILSQLEKEILPLQGFKPLKTGIIDVGLGSIHEAFPQKKFPLGVIHEFMGKSPENIAATHGFISGILHALTKSRTAVLWISANQLVFPPALASMGIDPSKIIFINLKREKDLLWATEEALRCDALTAVVSDLQDMDFTVSRRLQLAVEQSRVTGFVIRHRPRLLNTTASVCRWQIDPQKSFHTDSIPGLGYPSWQVELLKVRNGKPGLWQMHWIENKFRLQTLPMKENINWHSQTG